MMKGFTLIELLVVISIIAILSVMGMAIYGKANDLARDTKRKADIDAISKVYEQHYDSSTQAYQAYQDADFSDGKHPSDPVTKLDYDGLVGSSAKGFKICAILSDNTNYCRSSSRGVPPASAYICNPDSPPSRIPPCYFTDSLGNQRGYGDVNGDGKVSCSASNATNDDDILALKISGGNLNPTADQKKAADVDKSGSVNPSDSLSIQRYVQRTASTFSVCSNP